MGLQTWKANKPLFLLQRTPKDERKREEERVLRESRKHNTKEAQKG